MTKEQKLRVHLENVIFQDLPEGTHLNGPQLQELCSKATPEQKERAFQRALVHGPLLIDEERVRFDTIK